MEETYIYYFFGNLYFYIPKLDIKVNDDIEKHLSNDYKILIKEGISIIKQAKREYIPKSESDSYFNIGYSVLIHIIFNSFKGDSIPIKKMKKRQNLIEIRNNSNLQLYQMYQMDYLYIVQDLFIKSKQDEKFVVLFKKQVSNDDNLLSVIKKIITYNYTPDLNKIEDDAFKKFILVEYLLYIQYSKFLYKFKLYHI